jgi:hypothetical protein
MADERTTPTPGGYGGPGYGRSYGRDFGGGGRNQGFDGSWGQGYGASFEPGDYRAGVGGPGFGAGEGAETRPWTGGPRGGDLAGDETWRPGRDARDDLKGPFAGRGPKGWRRSDSRLREAVCERMMDDPLLDASGFEVVVEDGSVVLRGEVTRPDDREHAEMLAREAAGPAPVRNELRFRPARV